MFVDVVEIVKHDADKQLKPSTQSECSTGAIARRTVLQSLQNLQIAASGCEAI